MNKEANTQTRSLFSSIINSNVYRGENATTQPIQPTQQVSLYLGPTPNKNRYNNAMIDNSASTSLEILKMEKDLLASELSLIHSDSLIRKTIIKERDSLLETYEKHNQLIQSIDEKINSNILYGMIHKNSEYFRQKQRCEIICNSLLLKIDQYNSMVDTIPPIDVRYKKYSERRNSVYGLAKEKQRAKSERISNPSAKNGENGNTEEISLCKLGNIPKTPKPYECSICIEDKYLFNINCGNNHFFCYKCIEEYKKTSKSCPMCRQKFEIKKISFSNKNTSTQQRHYHHPQHGFSRYGMDAHSLPNLRFT
jgi:hypothetical protein